MVRRVDEAIEQRDAADEGRLEPCGSITVGNKVIVNQCKVVRPSQLIASVRPTVACAGRNGGPGILAELSRYFFLLGALPFVLLGIAHALATPLTPDESKGLSPRDLAYRHSMAEQTLLLTRRTNLWLAWVGFNLSHSLGAVLFGVVVLLVGRSSAAFGFNWPVFVPLAIVVSGVYLAVGVRYWFRTPIIGITISSVCFALSGMLRLLAG
jgi:hypothetical protein